MKQVKYNRGTIKLCSGSGQHSIVVTKKWRDITDPLIDAATNTPGMDLRSKPAMGRPVKAPQTETLNEEVKTDGKA